jgi:hypothetical protein
VSNDQIKPANAVAINEDDEFKDHIEEIETIFTMKTSQHQKV